MKVKELKIDQEVLINAFKYSYQGVKKVKIYVHHENKIVFRSLEKGPDKHFDITVGNMEIKALKIQIVAK